MSNAMPDAAQPPLLISYTLFENTSASTKVDRNDVPWTELVERIRNAPTYSDKGSCPLISFCGYGDTASAKGSLRYAENVLRAHGGEIDYDAEVVSIAEAAALLQAANIKAVLYTSPSHTPQAPRWRVLLPFSEAALPKMRAEYLARANRILGGIAAHESFDLSRSFFIGRVRGAEYAVRETHGRCIDMAADIEPLYSGSNSGNGAAARDETTDAELRAAFDRGEGRYTAMLKLSSRWAAHGMAADDIEATLLELLGSSAHNADGVDLREHARPLAQSAVKKFGESRRAPAPEAMFPDVSGNAELAPRMYPLIWFESLHAVEQKPYVVKGLLTAGSLVVVYGESNTGKSFLMLDLALAAAQGITWRGRLTRKTLVIYVAGESADSVRARVAAYRKQHSSLTVLPFAAIAQGINFLEAASVDALVVTINAAKSEHEALSVLVVIDTFARAIPGGNENDAQDVGLAVMAADAIRAATGACVAFVHHTGKDPAKGARGSSALRAAADTEILVEGMTDPRTATVTKQRDLQSGQRMTFGLEVVDLADDPEEPGKKITSCVVRHMDEELNPTPAMLALRSKNQRLFVAAMRARTESDPQRIWTLIDLRAVGSEIGLNKWTARRVVDAVVASGYTQPSVGGHRFTDGVHLGANGCNAPRCTGA